MTTAIVKKKGHKAKHLEPFYFKPGQSGNPKGRKKGYKWSLRRQLISALDAKGYTGAIEAMRQKGVDIQDGTHGDLVTASLLWRAEHGDMDAIKEIFKQTEKPLTREVDPDDPNPEGNNINVRINIVKVQNTVQNIKNIAVVQPKKFKLSK